LEEFFFNVVTAGYVPILTHPELTWIKSSYQTIRRLAQSGVWMQITAVSLTGAFGRTTRFPAERMIDEGCVHILATDTRTMCDRSPNLGEGREFAARRRCGASCLYPAPRLTRQCLSVQSAVAEANRFFFRGGLC
jgi:protein-tyrosine phosphatase